MYSFIPILLQSSLNQEKQARIKYFLTQASASALMLFGALISNTYPYFNLLIIFSLIIKLGIAPCYFWLPHVISNISWINCWILTSLQKIAPILILLNLSYFNSENLMQLSCTLRILIGRLGAFGQSQIRTILAYSSISHIGWITAANLSCLNIALLYFLIYLILVSIVIIPFISSDTKSRKYLNRRLINNPTSNFILIMSLINLGGIPPFLGFYPKLITLTSLINNNLFFLPICLIIGASLNLFFYLKILINIYFTPLQNYRPLNISQPKYYNSYLILSSLSFLLILALFLFS
jgi:NADH-ubiquinone oxidoreductase chain 2